MAKNKELELAIKIGGKVDKSLSGAASSAESTISKIGKTAGKIAKVSAVAFAAVGTAAVAAGKYLYDLGNDFNDAYNTIRIGTGATGEALEDLKDSFKNVYQNVPTDMATASSAVADYNTRLGLTGDTLEELSTQAIQVNKLLGDDTSSVIESTSKAFQMWNIAEEDMADKMDYIFKASQSTGTGFTTLATDVQTYGAQLQELGYSFEDSISLIGQLDKAGVNTSEVLGAMKKSVSNLAKDGLSASDGFEKYADAIKNAGDMTTATQIASEVFGTKAASSMAAAIRNGTINVDELTESLLNSQETIDACAQDTYTLSDRMQMFKQQAQIALEPLAMTVLDGLEQMLPTISTLLEALVPIFMQVGDSLTGLINDAMPVITDLAGMIVSDLLPVFGQIMSDVLPVFLDLIKALMPVVSRIVTTVLPPMISLFSKLLPPVVTIINMVLPILTQLLDALMPSFDVIVSTILPLIVQLIETCLPLIQPIISTVLPVIVQLIQQLLPPALTLISAILPVVISLIETLSPILGIVLEFITPILDLVIALIDPILQVFDALSPLFEILGNLIITILEPIMPLIEQLADAFSAYLAPALEFITDLFSDISEAISGVLGWIGDAASKIGDFFGKLFGGGEVDVAVNAVSGGEELPKFADGGIVTRATQAIVGEGGEPEAIIPLSKLDEVLSGGGTVQVTFAPTFNISGAVDKQAITEATDEAYQQFVAYMERFAKEQRRFAF